MENRSGIITVLEELKKQGSRYRTAAGFDMVVDNVARMIRKKNTEQGDVYFSTIEEFGNYILTKKNMSCSIDMKVQEEKIGGNMAIFSNALGNLGVQVDCVGSMGYPQVHPLFHNISPNCTLHSVCQTAQCNALEFCDGKIMLSSMDALDIMDWDLITERLGEERVISIFQDSQMMALLNWSELTGASRLFRKVYEHSVKGTLPQKEKFVFIDLSDASRKPEEKIRKILRLGEEFTYYRTTVFSMNENECRLVYQALFAKEEGSVEEMGRQISRTLGIDYLIVHLLDGSYGYQDGEIAWEPGYYTKQPKISTGGGDNFNAGVALGFLYGLSLGDCLKLGNATSGYYVRTGESPSPSQLERFMADSNNDRNGKDGLK